MKRLSLTAAAIALTIASSASAAGYCYINPKIDGYTPQDLSVVQLQCWVMMQEGHWTCNGHLCTSDDYPDWYYRATNFECGDETCSSSVLNSRGNVVLSGTFSSEVDTDYVDSVDYNGREYTCHRDELGGGSYRPSMCVR
jgi:hypothetical protein